jgi:DNA-binding transcriptional ArsR family regulator
VQDHSDPAQKKPEKTRASAKENGMNVSRQTIIQTAAWTGLGGLTALMAVAATSYDGRSSGTSLTKMARLVGIERRTLTAHMKRVAALGLVRESRMTRNKCWRRIAKADGDGVEIAADTIEMLAEAGDVAALVLLMRAVANDAGRFAIELPTLGALTKTSRNTLKNLLDKVQTSEFATITKQHGRFFDISVPEGTFSATVEPERCQESHQVRRTDTLAEIQQRARELLSRLRN